MSNQIDFDSLEQHIGYVFKQRELLRQAITHKSFSAQHNERLEFLGDSVLNCIIGNFVYQHYNTFNEGALSLLRASLVSGETLCAVAKELQLSKFLLLGKGEEVSGGRQRASILEDIVEAIIGAVFLDADWQTVNQVVLNWFASRLQNVHLQETTNYKSKLQEWLQARNMNVPVYQLKEATGQEHAQLFTVQCSIDTLNKHALGQGSSLKKAEQQAAAKLFNEIAQAYE